MKENFKKINREMTNKEKRGFTLFISLIVSGLILAIGFSIGNIILKELSLGSSGKNSQIAFYAADSAAECALYWDRKNADGTPLDISPFATDTPMITLTDVQNTIRCGTGLGGAYGSVLVADRKFNYDSDPTHESNIVMANARYATTTFYAEFRDVDSVNTVSCAKILIIKNDSSTVIEARGYNTPYSSAKQACNTSDPKTIERGLRVFY